MANWKILDNVKQELDHLRINGNEKGHSVGWDWERLSLTLKLGKTVYISAAPHTGKTEWWFEILINMSVQHGWRHVVFSPETGNSAEIFAELISKYAGRKFIKADTNDWVKEELFIREHFIVIESDDGDLTMDEFYDMVDEIEEVTGKIHTTTIDPWNELREVFLPEDLGREDKYLSRTLGKVRKNSESKKRLNCIITHVRDQQAVQDGNIRYYPMPTARDFAGGQVWFRKGMLMIILWRPPYGLCSPDGIPYENNEVHVKIAKAKPKGVATLGVYKMFLDLNKFQYYMMDSYMPNAKIYANRTGPVFEQQEVFKNTLKPNQEFDLGGVDWFKPIDDDEMPF
jgi:hypothetical protein